MLHPPIVVADAKGSDLSIWNTLQEAIAHLEPIDVSREEYKIFDSLGSVIALRVADDEILIDLDAPAAFQPIELEHRLRAYLRYFPKLNFDAKHLGLSDLIAKCRLVQDSACSRWVSAKRLFNWLKLKAKKDSPLV